MKKRLLEEPTITKEQKSKYITGGIGDKSQIVDQIIASYNKPSLKNISAAIRFSFTLFGINGNPFIRFFDNLKFKPTAEMNELFIQLIQMYDKKLVDINHEYLTLESLYTRSKEDFEYTINAFESILDPSTLDKFFDNTEDISEEGFMINGEIKPTGLAQKDVDPDTIYGTIENWQKLYGSKKIKDTAISINKYIKDNKIEEADFVEFISDKMKKIGMAGNITNMYVPKQSDMTYYITTFKQIMDNTVEAPTILSTSEQNKILKDKNKYYYSPERVPESLKKEGTVLAMVASFIYDPSEPEKNPGSFDDAYLFDGLKGLVIYHDDTWQKYDEYVNEIKAKSKTDINNRKKTFLNQKVIEDPKNIYSILAGILMAIDAVVK